MAIRAAWRALAVNPDDARAYLVLGESYLRLLSTTRERLWVGSLPDLLSLRQVQASTALNRAVLLQPDLAVAHYDLYGLYRDMNCLDLALQHLRTYAELVGESKVPRRLRDALKKLADRVKVRENEYIVASSRLPVRDRALLAQQKGLAGKALALLLEQKKGMAAFGAAGLNLEVELLLRTGRASDVLEWVGPEHRDELERSHYHMVRFQALAATGQYALARSEGTRLVRSLALGDQQEEPRFRELLARTVGKAMLDCAPGCSTWPSWLRRTHNYLLFADRVGQLRSNLISEANVTVLQGLLALEEGDSVEAEFLFHTALVLWTSPEAVGSGRGLDFNARPVAQGCLSWLSR
jgi:hypothetical protein